MVAAVSVRMSSFPAGLLARAGLYDGTCFWCRYKMEDEVASHLWPKVSRRFASVSGTLWAWTRAKEGGALLRGRNFTARRLGDLPAAAIVADTFGGAAAVSGVF